MDGHFYNLWVLTGAKCWCLVAYGRSQPVMIWNRLHFKHCAILRGPHALPRKILIPLTLTSSQRSLPTCRTTAQTAVHYKTYCCTALVSTLWHICSLFPSRHPQNICVALSYNRLLSAVLLRRSGSHKTAPFT